MGPVVGALAPRRAIQVAGLAVAARVASSAAVYAAYLFKARADDAGSAADACDPRRTIVIGRAATPPRPLGASRVSLATLPSMISSRSSRLVSAPKL